MIAAEICPQPVKMKKGTAEVVSVSNATPRLAPEVTPSTSGPASGLRKSVCINIPATESEVPVNMAVRALGSRWVYMISL